MIPCKISDARYVVVLTDDEGAVTQVYRIDPEGRILDIEYVVKLVVPQYIGPYVCTKCGLETGYWDDIPEHLEEDAIAQSMSLR